MDHVSPQLLCVFIVGLGSAALNLICRFAIEYFARRKLITKHGCKFPVRYPHKDPFLGLDAIWEAIRAGKSKTFLDRIRQQYEQYGNTFSSRFYTSPVINTVEPENIKSLPATNFEDYGVGWRRKNAFRPLLGNGIILLDGPQWSHSRALLRPNFTKNQFSDFLTFGVHVDNLIQVIREEGPSVDLGSLFLRLTADIATDILFGDSVQSLKNPDASQSQILRAFQDSQAGCEDRWRLGGFSVLFPEKKLHSALRKTHAYVGEHVRKALNYRDLINMEEGSLRKTSIATKERYVFLQALAKDTSDKQRLRDELLTIFFARQDTTASLLSNLFFVLARRPEIWERLHIEVDELGGSIPTHKQLKSMEYVHYCINESLRLHTVVPTNSRIANKDTILPLGGGRNGKSPILVPAGTMVAYHITDLHRRKDLWGEDANEFRPERWITEKMTEKMGWVKDLFLSTRLRSAVRRLTTAQKYLPFNGGPRICIGQELGITQVAYTTVRLLQTFKSIETLDPQPWTEGRTLTCCPANGVKVALTPH